MNKIISNEMQLCQSLIPINPKEGAFIKYKDENYVTIYNAIIDTYGIFKVDKDWSHYYWTPPQEYIYPNINWELIWKEIDFLVNTVSVVFINRHAKQHTLFHQTAKFIDLPNNKKN